MNKNQSETIFLVSISIWHYEFFYLNTGRIDEIKIAGEDNPQCVVVQPERSYSLRKSRKSHAKLCPEMLLN